MPGYEHPQGQFLGNEPLQQGVEIETVLLPIPAGTVYLAPVRAETEEELMRSVQDEIDVGDLTPVPRERSTLPEYDPRMGFTLLITVPDLRQMAYVSVDDMMVDAWVSKEVVELKLPVAIANIRSKLVVGFPMVTRERTTYSKYQVPPPSSYVRYRESLPMPPDLVLQDYLKA